MKKLRLLLFKECDRSCPGCCNKQWDLNELPIEDDFTKYSKILLTGGEPLLRPFVVKSVILDIRKQTNVPIILYTAKSDDIKRFTNILDIVDGITLTLHEQYDVDNFLKLNADISSYYNRHKYKNKMLRLNVFHNVNVPDLFDFDMWKIKNNIVWIDDCPLPTNEVFKRLK
jgi:organic radical activating enzyme